MLSCKEYIKKFTTVPEAFVDDLFSFYSEQTLQTDFVIVLDQVVKWLQSRKDKLVKTLKHSYKLNIDYIVTKPTVVVKKDPRNNNFKTYLLTPDCFKRLAMMSKSKNAEMVRTYYIQVENLFLKYRGVLMQGLADEVKRLEHNQKPKSKKPIAGGVYIIKVADGKTLYKLGRTKELANRLRGYQSGLADDIDVLFIYHTDDVKRVENCLKGLLQDHRYRKYKEVYDIDLDMMKEIVTGCGSLGAKLQYYKQKQSKLTGGYFAVLDPGA